MLRSLTLLVIILSAVAWIGVLEIGNPGDRAYAVNKGGAEEGRLTGKITTGPTRPVARTNETPSSQPVSGVRLVVKTPEGREVGSAVSDKQGAYVLSLPPGTYRVENKPLGPMQFTRDLPANVVVKGGQETRLDVHIDTGIR